MKNHVSGTGSEYRAMVMRVIGKAKPESEEDAHRIIEGIEADEELKELAEHNFCFCPISNFCDRSLPCNCVHHKHYRPL